MLGDTGCGEHADDETEGSAIVDSGLMAVVRAGSSEPAARFPKACGEGGVAAIEITFTAPCAVNLSTQLAQRFTADEISIGAGTVLDPETARVATLSGAQFVVGPSRSPETARLCNHCQTPYIRGAGTLQAVIEGMEGVGDIVKVSAGETLGRASVKAVRGRCKSVSLMPTGGVSLENVGEWIQAGCVTVGMGESLMAGAKDG
jgi:2-dehydro-3-deoxyphosphogluconate aldolase/(4S)-4-hydroxy-2-oxoglutarate aldolase